MLAGQTLFCKENTPRRAHFAKSGLFLTVCKESVMVKDAVYTLAFDVMNNANTDQDSPDVRIQVRLPPPPSSTLEKSELFVVEICPVEFSLWFIARYNSARFS